MYYNAHLWVGLMIKYSVLKTDEFNDWLDSQPPKMRTVILSRMDLIAVGHFGNHKRFEGLIELKCSMELVFIHLCGEQQSS